MKILVTGSAGFIGFHTCLKLVKQGHQVYGIDNINNYYDTQLKFDRLNELGFNNVKSNLNTKEIKSTLFESLRFLRIDITDSSSINNLFKKEQFDVVCNLAAQPGVRYSINNPKPYIDSNISGFLSILEACRNYNVKHLVYASSSSVYGMNKKVPFQTIDNVDQPISLYAATKKSNEMMAHTYGHLYGFKTTGLRFFTVYGPWGRPDMAYYLFTEAICNDDPIKVFNNGKMERDFTYIDDVVNGLISVIEKNIDFREHSKIYNIGNSKTEKLSDFISVIEDLLSKRAIKKMLPIQPGDVIKTYADIDPMCKDYSYKPAIGIKYGLKKFVEWFITYKKKNC